MNKSNLLVAFVGLSAVVTAQDIRPGTTADIMGQANALFATTNSITVNSATLTAEKVTMNCTAGTLGEEVQFGVATGFLGANGFVISNAYVETMDEDNPPTLMAADPFTCTNDLGVIGGPTIACEGTSALITANVTAMSGAAALTGDTAIYSINFTAAVATSLDLSYNLATFESPIDPTFYDSFVISIEGGAFATPTILAGGATNSGSIAGTDPWSLTPSSAVPSEFNSLPAATFFTAPAHSTGLRTLDIALDAGTTYTLEFHVADGATGVIDGSCNSGADQTVNSSLFVGLHTYHSGNPVGVTAGWDIGRVGHSTPGSVFSPDFQVTLAGAGPGTLLILGQSPVQIPGTTIGLLNPNEILIGIAPLVLNGPIVSTGTGQDVFPAAPPTLPLTLAGSSFNFQWWGNDGSGWKNSKGMNVDF